MASHADNSLFTVRPKFSRFDILQEINTELDGLPAQGVFAIDDVEFTYNPSIMTYNLTSVTSLDRILRVEADIPGASQLWPELHSWKLRRSANTTDFASGFALTLYSPGSSGRTVRVIYSKPLTHLTALSDDVQSVSGLPASANDILPLGASLRMSGYRENARNFYESQGDSRRPEEVRSGAPSLALQNYARLYLTRIRQEADNLASDYPIRRRLPA